LEWVSAVGPGGATKENIIEWPLAVRLWNRLVGLAISKIGKVERLLPYLGLYSYSYGENRPLTEKEREEARLWKTSGASNNPINRKLRDGLMAVQGYLGKGKGKGLEGFVSEQAFNDFFLEWVVRPYHDGLYARVKKAASVVRQLDPYILPEWKALDSLWSDVFQYKSDVSGFPTRAQVLSRKNDDIALEEGGRVLRLWLILRRIVRSQASATENLASQTREWPKAARRWDKGLGQDRLNMGNPTINPTSPREGSVLDFWEQQLADVLKRGGVSSDAEHLASLSQHPRKGGSDE
jgi:hypothetical protein